MKEREGNLGAFGFCWDGSQMLASVRGAEHLGLSTGEHCVIGRCPNVTG